jgi:hypothetical protein
MGEEAQSLTDGPKLHAYATSSAAPGARQANAPRRGTLAGLTAGSQIRMAERRVIGVEIDDSSRRPADPHVVTICLEDGRRIPRLRAISNIRYGVEAYFTDRAGFRVPVRVVDPCSRCGEAYLRADAGATQSDSLISLPPCPPRAAEPAKPRRQRP